MKLKSILFAISGLALGVMSSNAATMIVSNVALGPGDTLYANRNNSLMNGGIVTMGYFPASVLLADIDTIQELYTQLNNFTVVTSAAPGTLSAQLQTSNPGYADQAAATSVGTVSVTNSSPLLGRQIYSIVTNFATLGQAASAPLTDTSEFALVAIGAFGDDVPFENQYSSNPAGKAPIIGTLGAFNGDAGAGDGAYLTLRMDAVPEPSAALLGALGALGLLRRRRN
jgi:MYXO-CTERM domain-containing protein